MKRIATLKITNFEDVKLLTQALTDNDYSVLVQFNDLVDKRLRFNNKANEYLVHIITGCRNEIDETDEAMAMLEPWEK